MDKQYFIKLLHNYRQGNVTNEERQFLESYYNLFRNEPDVFNRMSLEEKNELEKEIKESVWKGISKEEKTGAKIISINKRFVRMVATAAVFIGIIGSLFFFYNRSGERQSANYAFQQSKDKSNDTVKAVISLHQNENRVIFLPDGSTVFLSPGSRLNYPSTFDGMKKREVYLQGQAFFDIKHNATKPFIVHTGQVATTVLGTAFNIKALPDEKFITVTVNRGRVSVSDLHKTLGIITPREQISYNTENQTSALTKVTNDSYLDWKNRDLFIDNLTLAEAAKLLEEQYKIKIIIKDSSIKEQRFTATFPKNETLEVAVKSISEFNGLSYSINRDKSIVTINNPKK
jgi:ferric-dicitrate binding protein FerR (iron transport regulator)